MTVGAPENTLLLSTLSILQIIKEAQQQHGLRHGDYLRYRSYCSRKLRRVRKSLHATNTHKVRNFQQKSFTVEQVAVDSRYLLLCLFEAERCWAFSMQMKQEANTEPRKRFHLINKLRRAVKHSENLENYCKSQESNVDVATNLEAQAYNAWLHGCLAFELQDWHRAKDYFSTSKSIYDQLSKASSLILADQSKSTALDLFQQRCQDMLTPQLRYCAFKIGDESAAADLLQMRRQMGGDQENLTLSDIDKLIAQTREKQAEQIKSEVVWCNHKINIPRAPNKVKSFCANLKQFDAQLKEADNLDNQISLYEQLLIDCRDAMQVVRDENKAENFRIRRENEEEEEEEGADSSAISTDALSEAQILYFWLSNVRLGKTVDKYLTLIGGQQNRPPGEKSSNVDLNRTDKVRDFFKPSKPLDLVRLYDGVLQNLNEITYLPGVRNDPILKNVQVQIAYYTAFRCYFVAEVFANQKKWLEALALYVRCTGYCTNASNSIKGKESLVKLDIDLLDELSKVVNSRRYTAHANCVIGGRESSADPSNPLFKAANADKAFIEDFKTYRRLQPQDVLGPRAPVQVTRLPPDFLPMPCKPLFFDLALNHLQFPSLESKIEDSTAAAKRPSAAAAADQTDQSKAGLGGLMKGWFWGGAKK